MIKKNTRKENNECAQKRVELLEVNPKGITTRRRNANRNAYAASSNAKSWNNCTAKGTSSTRP